MSFLRSQKPIPSAEPPNDNSRSTESDVLFAWVEQDANESFPAAIGECLASLKRSLGLLSDAVDSRSVGDQCSLLGAIDRQVYALRVTADKMESDEHPLALLAGILATEAEARADAEAHAMLRSFRTVY